MSSHGVNEAFGLLPKRDDSNDSSQTLISPAISWSPVLPKYYSKVHSEPPFRDAEKASIAKRPRRVCSASSLAWFALDFIIALLAVYFIAFAIAAYANNGTPIVQGSDSISDLLLQGAKIGTTAFTILYAAIVGRCLLSIAAWRLEYGCSFGFIEQLLSSRTVSSAVLNPIRLRIFSWVTPGLIILWALSPIGSQAAQRVVYQGLAITQASGRFYYLETPLSTTYGEVTQDKYEYKASVAFQSALLASSVTGNDSLDIFGNVRIPLLESFPEHNDLPPGAWLPSSADATTTFASYVGVPFNGTQKDDISNFTSETSYMHANCSIDQSPGESYHPVYEDEPYDQRIRANGLMAIRTDASHNASSQRPRNILLSLSLQSFDDDYWYTTNMSCTLTTTYIEAQVLCNGSACAATALRRSILPHASPNITVLDGVNTTSPFSSSPASTAGDFLGNFINSTGNDTGDGSVPIAQYLIDPNSAFGLRTQFSTYNLGFQKWVPIGSVPPETLSIRLTQLLNTYRMSALSPSGVNGGFGMPSYGTYEAGVSEGTIHRTKNALYCSVPWFVMLLLSSFVMLSAGLLTAILNLMRRGPEILDSFTGLAQTSRLMHIHPASSIDSGSKRARDLRDTTVILGDIEPGRQNGFLAVTVPQIDLPVEQIRRSRQYL